MDMKVKFGRALVATFAIMAMLVVAVVGCGSDPTPTPKPAPAPAAKPTATPVPPTATPLPKPKLIFAGLNWSSAAVQNEIVKAIFGPNGYGYETDEVAGGTIPLMEALTKGDVNVNLELWLPNQQAAYEKAKAKGVTREVGDTITTGAWQTAFIIPKYTADANPWLKSVEDLKDPRAKDLFKSKLSKGKVGLVTCIPGWECEKVNAKQVAGYGLSDHVTLINPGSYAALNGEILGAYEKKENIVHYYWGPEALPGKLTGEYGGYVMLEEPPYTKECFDAMAKVEKPEDNTAACAYPLAEVLSVVNKTQITDENAPELISFLKKYGWTGEEIEVMLSYMADNKLKAPEVAAWALQQDQFSAWKTWVSPEIAAKVLAGL